VICHNSGFSVHNEVRIQPGDTKGIENLAQYIIRNTFSLAKLSYVESSGTVIYHSKMSHGGYNLGSKVQTSSSRL